MFVCYVLCFEFCLVVELWICRIFFLFSI